MNSPKVAFELTPLRLQITQILPIRKIDDPAKQFTRYSAILTSIKEVGMIEPLMVYPQKGAPNTYLLMDGHLRLHPLKTLGHAEADCLVSTDDEGFTYNARINRIPAIQEHFMICEAVQNGVSPERIAAALNRQPSEVYGLINLLNGIHAEAAELLKDKPVYPRAVCLMRRVTAQRQIEIAELMISANNFTEGYAEALVFGTPKTELVKPGEPKAKKGLDAEEIARMQAEMETLEHDFRAVEQSYGANVLNFTVTKNYLKKLLENGKVTKFLSSKHPDLFSEFQAIIAMEAI
jgi:hypothetical protein